MEYHLYLDNKASGIFRTIVQGYPDIFDKELFSKDNIYWALTVIDNRLLFSNWEASLIPMIDCITFGVRENDNENEGKFSPQVDENRNLRIPAQSKFAKGSLIVDNIGFSNEKLVMSYGQFIQGLSKDCFTLSVSFTGIKEDTLAYKRKEFFSKYFLFDQNHHDLV